jgi:hypothetical protein
MLLHVPKCKVDVFRHSPGRAEARPSERGKKPSHNRDSGIPQPKLIGGYQFLGRIYKWFNNSILKLCFEPWHGHCNSFGRQQEF